MVDMHLVVDQAAAADGNNAQPGLSPGITDKTADDDDVMKSEILLVSDQCSAESEAGLSKAMEYNWSDPSSYDSNIDHWNRSIVISDVPADLYDILIMSLEVKKRGGGKIDSVTHDTENRKVLVTFNDAAGNCC